MFKIEFEDQNGQKAIPWQNSWGLTTRTIGVMVMVHSDDKGLVLPPRIAPIQCVIVPIVVKQSDAANKAQADMCAEMVAALSAAGIRVKLDDRTNYNPGWKYNHWELKGVPLRIEVGPRDVEARQARCVRRDSNEKEDVPMACLTQKVALLLVTMQHDLLSKARKSRDDNIVKVWEWKDFVPALQKGHMVLTPFCNETEFEELVKDKSKAEALAALGQETEDEREATPVAAKTLCIPFDAPELPAGTPCFVAPEKPATCWVLWGRSY